MPRFHELIVTAVEKTIRDAVVVTLRPPEDADFSFEPGQYLTLAQDFDGQEIRRTYSICTGLDDGRLQVGIKRVEGGAFSTFANEVLSPGDTLRALPPAGRFTVPIAPDAAHRYLAFAGGSGITPILSHIRSILAREPASQFTLVYANRGVNTIMFREEIEDLKNLHMGRLRVIHVLEHDAQEIDLFTGRVDEKKCKALFQGWIDVSEIDRALICGPQPMMEAIARALEAHGVPKARILYELFTSSAQTGPLSKQAVTKHIASTTSAVRLSVTLDGATRSFEMDPAMTVLEAALAQDLDVPFSCQAGVCSTCRCRVLDGEVEMDTYHALEDYEVAQGFALSCQARAVGTALHVDYDQ